MTQIFLGLSSQAVAPGGPGIESEPVTSAAKESYPIATLAVEGGGRIGVAPLPGLRGDLAGDLAVIAAWGPALVLSMTETEEMILGGCQDLDQRLAGLGIAWAHLPIRDFGGLSAVQQARWPALSARLQGHLDQREGVLLHCRGGKGRSGMIALRLLVERGEVPKAALARLRRERPGAVETAEQSAWGSGED